MSGGPPPGRFRRALARVPAAAALSIVFVGSAAGALLAHLNLPVTRRIVRDAANALLAPVFQGEILVEDIDRLDLSGIDVAAATIVDPNGAPVIRARGVRARCDFAALARDALVGEGDLRVALSLARVESAEVMLAPGDDDAPTIAAAFTPRAPTKPRRPSPPSAKPPRRVVLELARIEIGRAWVHGSPAPGVPLDADVARLAGSLLVEPEGLALDVERAGIAERMLLPAAVRGVGSYSLRVAPPAAEGEPPRVRMWSSLAGHVGAVQVGARMELADGRLVASADVPRATPADLHETLPGLVVRAPLSGRVEIAGEAPVFEVGARVRAREGGPNASSVLVEGTLDTRDPLRLVLDVTAQDVNPRVLSADAPPARLSAIGRARLLLGPDGPAALLEARTDAAIVEGWVVPAMDVHVAFARGVVTGSAIAHEQGAPVSGTFAWAPPIGLRFDAESAIPSIRAAPRLAGPVDGAASVHVAGTLRGDHLDAHVDGTVRGLRAGSGLSVGSASVRGHVSGPLDRLAIDAAAAGAQVRAGGYDFANVSASARGPIAAPELAAKLVDDLGGVLSAKGRFDPRAGAMTGLRVKLERDGEAVAGSIARVGGSGGSFALSGVELAGEGVGTLAGSLEVRGDDLTGTLRGDEVDVGRVARLLGFPLPVKGVANVDIALRRDAKGRSGHVKLELENGAVAFVPGISAHVTAAFEHDEVTLGGLVRLVARDPDSGPDGGPCLGTIAQVRVGDGRGTLRGPLLAARTWSEATGSMAIAAEEWDLRCLKRLVPFGLPISEVKGRVTAKLRIDRPEGQRFPSVRDLVARTHGLEIAGPQGFGDDAPAWESRHVDFQLKGSLDGETGKAGAALTLYDGELLGDASLDVTLDLPTLVDHPARRAASLRASALSGRVAIPRRAIDSFGTLPAFVSRRIPDLDGEVRFDGYVDGTMDEPFFALRAQGFGVAHRLPGKDDPSPWALPIDIDVLATYDASQASIDAEVTRSGKVVATANAQIVADLATLLGERPAGRPAWTGGMFVKLEDLPLGEIPYFADGGVGGRLRGSLSVKGLNERPSLETRIEAPALRVADVLFDRAVATLRIAPDERAPAHDMAVATLELAGHPRRVGRMQATAYAGIAWTDGLVPRIDGERPADLYANLQAFRLAVLQPVVSGALAKIDGFVQGHVRVGWGRVSQEDRGSVDADVRLRQGAIHIPQLGQELRNAEAHVVAKGPPKGGSSREAPVGTIRMDSFVAEGVSGRVTGRALARLAGLRFVDAAGTLHIEEGEELPITLEGAPLGKARGDVAFQIEKHDRDLAFTIRIPSMHVDLPASTSRSVQPLEDHPDVKVTHPMGPEEDERPKGGRRYTITFDIGSVHVERSDVDVTLKGTPSAPVRIEVADTVRVTGDIDLSRGKFEVFGKTFEIDRGLVRLRAEDASNPYVNVRAFWDAPDGTRVFVEYVGNLKPPTKDKLHLSSNPPFSEAELLSALLFGTELGEAESTSPATNGGAGNMAVGVGGGLAAEQFNAVLSGIAPLRGLSTRFGTSEEGNLQTSVAYELGDTLRAQATFERPANQATPAAGAGGGSATPAPEQQQQQATNSAFGRTEISIDWRFHRQWLLRGKVGVSADRPSSGLELLWQYRY